MGRLLSLVCLCAPCVHARVRLQADVFAGEYGAKRLADLKLRVIEHNVLVVSKYYTRISTARLAELLDLTPEEVRLRAGCLGGGGRRQRHVGVRCDCVASLQVWAPWVMPCTATQAHGHMHPTRPPSAG